MTSETISKAQAADLFGGTLTSLARALGITKQAINNWPDQLSDRQTNEVIGAALMQGRISKREDAFGTKRAA